MKRLALLSFAAVSSLLLANCAHEPVTKANAAQASSRELSSESRAALNDLYAQNPEARRLGRRAAAVLVFPKVLKGGFVVGAEGGNGTMFGADGTVKGYYQTAAGSYGLQAGVQKFGYALFLMNQAEIRKINSAEGWDVGTAPGVVVVDRGATATLTAKTGYKGAYAFFFDQKGLMAGVSLQGSKITRIHPGN
jgi:lipid-binding SYLF domain-containing protein